MHIEMMRQPVSDFAPQSGEAPDVLQYPYSRPAGSYLTDGSEVVLLAGETHQDIIATSNAYLSDKNVPGIDERIPVVGFGSNASPYQLQKKMSSYGQGDKAETQVVPNEQVIIKDAVIAWHGKPGQNGSTFAELYKGDETQGHESTAMVQYFTKEQLAIMHTTEGETYHFVPVTVETEDGTPIQAYAYVASDSQLLRDKGMPVEVALTTADATDGKLTAEQAVDLMLAHADIPGISNARELVVANSSAKLAEKKVRQDEARRSLVKLGMSTDFSYPGADEVYIGRADFGTIDAPNHTTELLQLAEQHLAGMRPTKEQIAARAEAIQQEKPETDAAVALRRARIELDVVADPVKGIRKRATTEIGRRISADVLEPGEWSSDGTREVKVDVRLPDNTREVKVYVWKKVKIDEKSYRIVKEEKANG